MHFEAASNGPAIITWIGREHALYSDASPISFVEHCVTFRHDRRLLSLWGLVHNWPTSRWSATKKKKKKERKLVFIKRKWNHVVFSRATTLSFHSVLSDKNVSEKKLVWIRQYRLTSDRNFYVIKLKLYRRMNSYSM